MRDKHNYDGEVISNEGLLCSVVLLSGENKTAQAWKEYVQLKEQAWESCASSARDETCWQGLLPAGTWLLPPLPWILTCPFDKGG